jgi:hypothetical protein
LLTDNFQVIGTWKLKWVGYNWRQCPSGLLKMASGSCAQKLRFIEFYDVLILTWNRKIKNWFWIRWKWFVFEITKGFCKHMNFFNSLLLNWMNALNLIERLV